MFHNVKLVYHMVTSIQSVKKTSKNWKLKKKYGKIRKSNEYGYTYGILCVVILTQNQKIQ